MTAILNVILGFFRMPAVNEEMAAGTKKASVWISNRYHPGKVLYITQKALYMAPATVAAAYTK